MTPAASPPEPSRVRRLIAGALLAAGLLATLAVPISSVGCSKAPKHAGGDSETGVKGDPWKVAGARLKKETDLIGTKAALTALTSDVNSQEGQKLPGLTDDGLAALAAVVPLSPSDREEIRSSAFSAHDPIYLADCFYLRDAARSLALTGLPPERQAELAFEWVCRQVYLQPWPRQTPDGPEPTVLPPTAVLRRGSGSGLERMYVFLALLQQLDLDGCLIGTPDSRNQQSRDGEPLQYPYLPPTITGFQRGPFWAAGVRIGADVRLFDPWRSGPFPVTLNQLKANPVAAKAWFEDKENLSKMTAEDAKKATVYLAVPVNALSPRMATFESNLKGELGVKVAYDLAALNAKRAAFPDPKPVYWNPEADPFAYGRAARSYLPRDLGGTDGGPQGSRLYEASLRDQIPASAFKMPEGLEPDPAKVRLGATAATELALAFIEPPNPRERIQRGQLQEAAVDLVAKQERFSNGLERLRVNKDADEQIREWVKVANNLYRELGSARLEKNKEAEAAAAMQVDNHWRQPGAQFLVDRSSAEVGRAEASYLLALCKHEQAERLQPRLERGGSDAARLKAEALDAWKTALSAWRTYEQMTSAHAGFPGRAVHGRALAARAAKFAEADAKK